MKIQQWIDQQAKVGGKLKLRLSGMKPAKDRVESFNWQRRCNDSTYSFWLACLFLSNPTCFSPTYQLESFLRICHKRKSSCHFAWRNGSIAVWIFVHPTEYGSDIGLERLPYKSQSKIISINIRILPLLSRMKVKHARISEITILILSLKFIGSFEAAAFSITTKLAFRAWSL